MPISGRSVSTRILAKVVYKGNRILRFQMPLTNELSQGRGRWRPPVSTSHGADSKVHQVYVRLHHSRIHRAHNFPQAAAQNLQAGEQVVTRQPSYFAHVLAHVL